MSDDASYSNFLNQANQDTGGASAQSSGGGKQLKAANAPVPKSLQSLDTVYVSDADEPFEGVSLNWEGGELSADKFKKLVGHDSEAEELSTKDFDPKGQYKSVTSAVEKEVDGKVHVFRIETGGARAEYWIVGVQKSKVVGVRAKAVES